MPRKTKWRREQDAYDDNKQAVFSKDNPHGFTDRRPPITVAAFVYSGKFFCPFCLHIGNMSEFRVKVKKGWSDRKAECPECKNGMMMKSLVKTQTIEEYAEWCFMYAASGFWQKVPFEKFRRRLKELGWSYRFWSRYKALKGEDTGETYEEHMEKEQEAWAREQGLI